MTHYLFTGKITADRLLSLFIPSVYGNLSLFLDFIFMQNSLIFRTAFALCFIALNYGTLTKE
jgi:hypothetical protein